VITMLVFGLLANFARREPQAAAALRSQGPGWMARFLGLGVKPPKTPKERKPRRQQTSRKPARAGKSGADVRLWSPKGRTPQGPDGRGASGGRSVSQGDRLSGAPLHRSVPDRAMPPVRSRSAGRGYDRNSGGGSTGRTVRR
jgi:cell division protein FtsW